LCLCFYSCSHKIPNNNATLEISGTVTGEWEPQKVYLEHAEFKEIIDSANVINGIYSLSASVAIEPYLYKVTFKSNEKQKAIYIFAANEKIELNPSNMANEFSVNIKGATYNKPFEKFNNWERENRKSKNKNLKDLYQKIDTSAISYDSLKELESTYLLNIYDKGTRKVIDAEIANKGAAFLLSYAISGKDKGLLEHYYNLMSTEEKNSRHGKAIALEMVYNQREKGDESFDFEMFDLDGNSHMLSDFRGKYVLLDFSASWCGPCHKLAQELKGVHSNYKDTIVFISISIDKNKTAWKNMVENSDLPWPIYWGGKTLNNGLAANYEIGSIPKLYFINKDGVVVSRMGNIPMKLFDKFLKGEVSF
jgi:thiol-disulfide isomerase/thioredoxin